jgi:hypothetical protein
MIINIVVNIIFFFSNPISVSKWHPPWQITSTIFDIGFNLGLGGFIGG